MRTDVDRIGWFYNSFIIENDLILVNLIYHGIRLYDFDLKFIKHIEPIEFMDNFKFGTSIFMGLNSHDLLIGGKVEVTNELKLDNLHNLYDGKEDGGPN